MADVVDFQGGKRSVQISEGRGQDFQSIASISKVEIVPLPMPHASVLREFCRATIQSAVFTFRQAFGKRETMAFLAEIVRANEKTE